MTDSSFFYKTFVFISVFLLSHALFAQKSGMEVNRCSGVDRNLPVRNVTVDANNRKWVANRNGVFQVKSPSDATPRLLTADERNVLSFPGGNLDYIWSESAFKRLTKADPEITCAWYDAKSNTLSIGTKDNGLFQFKTNGALQLTEKFTAGSSKLPANQVHIVFQDKNGRYWVGTSGGLMSGTAGKWKSDFANYEVRRIREYGSEIYVLADNELNKLVGEKWVTVDIDEKMIEGEIRDFGIDKDGKIWMISGVITQYDPLGNTYKTFGGPENYTSLYGARIAVDADGAAWIGTDDKGLYIVDKTDALHIDVVLEQGISCNGNGKDAELLVRVDGGTGPYTYQWSGGLTGNAPKNVATGNYDLTVSDSKGHSRSTQVPVPDTRMRLTVKAKKAATGPEKADGAAEVDVAGNVSGIKVQWDNGEILVQAVKLTPGEHTVTVTNQKGCVATAKVVIQENVLPMTTAIKEKTPLKCAGEKTAALTVLVNGGKAPFQYQWNNPALSGDQPQGIGAGSYALTVKDALGSTATAEFEVRPPVAMNVSVEVQTTPSSGNADGRAVATVEGGNPPYAYEWGSSGETAKTAFQLPAGEQALKVRDANGCISIAKFNMVENIPPLVVSISFKTSVRCRGDKNVALTVKFQGGKKPFQYKWNDPAITEEQPTNLGAGFYQVTVTDAAGSTSTANITIKEPDLLTMTARAVAPASTGNADGKALATAKGGNGEYFYRWDNDETGPEASKLSPGKHSVKVNDANGCEVTASVDITENILALNAIIEEKKPVKCAGEKTGALAVDVKGGKGPFQYKWSNPALSGAQAANLAAGDYQVTVTDVVGNTATATLSIRQPDALNISVQVQGAASTGNADGKATATVKGGKPPYTYQWDNAETTPAAVKLAPGKRTVSVTDAVGCSASVAVDITENILPMSARIEEKAGIKCAEEATGSLSAQISGGKGPYQYLWSNPALKGAQVGNLTAGLYVLTVTDAAGSSATATYEIKEPQRIALSAEALGAASTGNADGKAKITAKGGTAPYTYQWDNGETSASAAKLPPGQRTFTVTDANGCSATNAVAIAENILALSVKMVEKGAVKCAGDKGSIAVQVNGGKAPFTYAWNNPALQGAEASGLESGTYTVTVTDAKGVTQTATISFPPTEPISVEVTYTLGATNESSNDGKASIFAKGGFPPLSILWDNRQTGQNATKLSLGAHSVTVTDTKGCTQKINVPIEKRILPELTGAVENGQTIRMRLLNFETDKSDIRPESYAMLDELHDFMVRNSGMVIEIGGHTNNLPSDDFADKLSTARAKAVVDYLVEKGIDAKRLEFKGYGKRYPIASNLNPEGRKANQRVEIKILKIR